MENKFALNLGEYDLLPVQHANSLGQPMVGKKVKLLLNIDDFRFLRGTHENQFA
jgi:hypothetical protein